MLPKFLTSLNHWLNIPLKSGLFFWLGGLMAWLYHILDWTAVHKQFSGVQPPPESLMSDIWRPFCDYIHHLNPQHATLLLFLLLFVMMLANVVVSRLTFPTLRFLEGYGPLWNPLGWFARLWGHFGWQWRSLGRIVVEIADKLYYAPRSREFRQTGNPARLSPERLARYLALEDEQLYLLPKADRLPTRLGNTLRSYERRPRQKYGLEAVVCWPHLWLTMPESARAELAAARQNLDDAIQIWLWSALFLLWIIWTWWALPVAGVLMVIAYHWALQAAITYGKLLETAFDLYRPLLYQALRLPLPDDPATEKQAGENLSAYLLRGTKAGIRFAP